MVKLATFPVLLKKLVWRIWFAHVSLSSSQLCQSVSEEGQVKSTYMEIWQSCKGCEKMDRKDPHQELHWGQSLQILLFCRTGFPYSDVNLFIVGIFHCDNQSTDQSQQKLGMIYKQSLVHLTVLFTLIITEQASFLWVQMLLLASLQWVQMLLSVLSQVQNSVLRRNSWA